MNAKPPGAPRGGTQGAAYGICRLVKITRKNGAVIRLAESQTDLVIEGETYMRARGFRVSSLPFVLNARDEWPSSRSASSTAARPIRMTCATGSTTAPRSSSRPPRISSPRTASRSLSRQFRRHHADRCRACAIPSTGCSRSAKRLLVEHYSPMCRTFFGDARCKVPLGPLTMPARSSAISGFYITISGAAASQPADYWKLGLVIPTSGPGVGDAFEIRDWNAADHP